MMRRLFTIGILLLALSVGMKTYGQDFSNKGKEFWLAYSYHVGMSGGSGSPAMTLYLTSDVTTTYSVDIFGVTTVQSGTINANQVISVPIPNTYFINGDGLFTGRAIRVSAVKPIVVYSFITRSQASAASLCLPTNVLGKEYYSSSFTQNSNENNSNSYITIVGVEDNTSVEIVPAATTVGGWAANSINTVTINKGQVYQVLGTTTGNTGVDLSGTKVRSIASGSGGCKKIAVFSGTGKISIGSPGCTGSSADNLYQQLYPVSSWGKYFLTVPSSGRPNNHYRIYRNNAAANIYLNGTLIPSASFTNNYYQFYNNTPNSISSDLPISLAQYFTSQNCPTPQNPYDPDMIMLSPVEQNISKVTLVSSPLTVAQSPAPNYLTHQHHIHVIMRNGGTGQSSFRFDGAPYGQDAWVPHPQDPTYSYLYITNITSGNHTISSDSGFNAAAYGYGSAETYGYSAGANVKDLYQQISVASQYAIEPAPSVCKGSPFRFRVSLPYCADSIKWNLTNLPGPPAPSMVVTNYSTCSPGAGGPDSTTVVNGKTLYWYSIPTTYNFTTSGSFQVLMTVYKQNTDGCGNEQEIEFDLNVYDPPIPDFTWTGGGCVAEPVLFQDNSSTPRPSYLWFWDFGDPSSGASNTASAQNPSHTFSGPGTYNIKFHTITTPGCISAELTKQVTVTPIPSATIDGAATVCINSTPEPVITFTATDGKAPYTFTYNINGGPALTISTSGTNNSVSITVPTNIAGTFRYNLTEVKNTGSTLCIRPLSNTYVEVSVNANVALSLTSGSNMQSVCQNTSIGNITYSIGGGGDNATVVGLPAGVTGVYNSGTKTFVISGTPANPGTYSYTVTATGTCLPSDLTGTITVNPDASISLTSANSSQTLCINTAINSITYSIGGGGTGGTVTGLPVGVVGIFAGGVFSISGTPTVSGTFNYTVTTTGTCIQKSETGTITVNPDATLALTSVPATTSQSLCINTAISDITYAIGGSGSGGSVAGLPHGVTGVYNSGVFTISGTPTVVGTYPFTVTTTGICVQKTLTGTITVNPDAAIALTSAPASNAQELCRNSVLTTITYAISGGGTGGTVTGLPAGVTGTFSGGVFTISGSPTADGTFNYTVTTTGTCVQKSETGTIIVNPLPTVNFNFTAPSCATRTISFQDMSSPNVGTLTSWAWNFNDPPGTSALQNPTHTFANTGTYPVSLVVTNSKGCTIASPFTRNVTINPRPQAGFIVPEVCINDVATVFTDTSHVTGDTWDPNGYEWNFGDPGSGAANTSATMNGSHLYTTIGPYNVMHVVTTSSGCKDTTYNTIFINAADPVSDFNITLPAALCSNDSISLVNRSTISQGSVTKLEIYWDAVGAPATFETVDVPVFNGVYKHKYPTLQTAMTYTIRMVAYSGTICFTQKTMLVTVNAAPRVQFNTMPDVCFDAVPFQITQASEAGGVPGTPFFSGPGVSPTGIFNPSSVSPGNSYTIKYLWTASVAGCKDSITQTITVIDTATARFTYQPIVCEKGSTAFNSLSSSIPASAGTIIGWNWSFGDPGSGAANTSTVQNPSHNYMQWGTYNVTLQVVSDKGCRSTVRTIPVFVNPVPRPDFSVPASVCLPSANVTFNNLSTIPDNTQATFSYLWDFGDPGSGTLNVATGSSPSHIYNAVGPFSVNLQVTSGAGCPHDTTIMLNTIHPQPLADFIVDKTEVCIGDGFVFTDNTNPMDGVTTNWFWNLDDGNSRTVNTFPYTYTAAGTYDVELYTINSHGCRSTTYTEPVTVHPYPVVDAGPDRFVLEGGQVTLEPVVTGNDLNYVWTPNNSYIIGSNAVKNLIVRGVEDIRYLLTVTARGGCTDTSSVFIKVLKNPGVPNIFSPNGDGVHDKWIISYLETYPGCTVDVYNRYGQLIFHSVGYQEPWDGKVKGRDVPVGTYYYIVNPKNGRSIMSGYVDVIR